MYQKLYKGDCLEVMKDIPDGSIDLILCDLPYGTIKNMGIDGWKNKDEQCSWDETLDNKLLFKQYERVLRENGIVILFSQEPFTSTLRTLDYPNIEFAYPSIWIKDHFANGLIAKKAPVNYFEDINIFYKKYDASNMNPLRSYFDKILKFVNCKSCNDIDRLLKHQKANHTFRVNSTQFKLCTEKVYNELIHILKFDKECWFKTYNELLEINSKFTRTFNLPNGYKVKSNVYTYKKDYDGLHPTQKPVLLLEDLINTYSNSEDLVLDNCMGSNSTGIACLNTNRNYIGIEMNDTYFNIGVDRTKRHIQDNNIDCELEMIE